MTRHAVISGSGIAGPALAHQLAARGWRTTVLERFPEARSEGQNVDVRGAAREVVRRMGIDADVRAANTGEVGMRFVDADGSPVASFPMGGPGESDGPTAELEILRGELSRILIEHTRETTEYRFGTQIADLTDRDDHVTVALDDGSTVDADVVVIAEGLRSTLAPVRHPDPGQRPRHVLRLRHRAAAGHRRPVVELAARPRLAGRTRPARQPRNVSAILTFISDVRGLEDLDRADQVAILRRTFADVGGLAPRVLAELDDAPLYFDALGQVSSSQWTRGRVALLGDAAYTNATFGGGGTSLGLIGAYVLAGELSRGDDDRAALLRYEQLMRPHVETTAPQSVMKTIRRANPRTEGGIRVLHAGARVAAGPVGRGAMKLAGKRLVRVAADDLRLPDYSDTVVQRAG